MRKVETSKKSRTHYR